MAIYTASCDMPGASHCPSSMPFLDLATEIIIIIFDLHLRDNEGGERKGLLLPSDRLSETLGELERPTDAEYPLCLTDSIPEERVLSRQASACAEQVRADTGLPRIYELSHISSPIRSIILGTPQLWARQALCWPARSQVTVSRAGACPLAFASAVGLCACIFHDIRPSLHRAARVDLVLPSSYLRADGADLSLSSLVRAELVRAFHLTDLQIRFDSHRRHDVPSEPLLLILPGLRRARLQNANFIPAGSGLQVLHLAAEPSAPGLTLSQFLETIRQSPNLKELAVQNVIRGEYRLPWSVGIAPAARLVLEKLEHLTCSGARGLSRALLYWIDVPGGIDFHVDADFFLGTVSQPFDLFPSQLAPELSALLYPREIVTMLEYARSQAAAEEAGSIYSAPLPNVPPSHPLSYLALNVIPDSEASRPMEMWPRLMIIAAAEDKEGALRGLRPECDPVSLGPGRMRRVFTMRNFYASFPGNGSVAMREGFPRHRRPNHLGLVASLLLTAYVLQADAEETIIHLALGGVSWVPQSEEEWLFVLADLPRLRCMEVHSAAYPESVRSLASFLAQDRAMEELQEIRFSNLVMGLGEAKVLAEEVYGLMEERETDEEEALPHIVWSLS